MGSGERFDGNAFLYMGQDAGNARKVEKLESSEQPLRAAAGRLAANRAAGKNRRLKETVGADRRRDDLASMDGGV